METTQITQTPSIPPNQQPALANNTPWDHPFAKLYGINVNDHVEKKGGFSYLSWPYAVAQLRLADPSASWEVRRFDGMPYLATEAGVFVEVAVTYAGVTLSQIHPVLDGRNRPIMAPSSFEINTSIQRCLVKAIALHGLGLYIYAGEDLPQPVHTEAANDPSHQTGAGSSASHESSPIQRPTLVSDRRPVKRAEGGEYITRSQQAHVQKLAMEVGVSLDRVLSYFGVVSLSDITATDFVRVIRSLEKRRKVA